MDDVRRGVHSLALALGSVRPVFHVAHHATHHTITDTNKSLTKATATTTASKQEALEEHYRPSTHGKSCRAKSCDQLAPSPTYTHATPLVV